jgi:hypothetical protein
MKEEFEAKESERIAAAAANPSPTGRGGSVDNLSDPAHVANLLERAAMGHKIKEKNKFFIIIVVEPKYLVHNFCSLYLGNKKKLDYTAWQACSLCGGAWYRPIFEVPRSHTEC